MAFLISKRCQIFAHISKWANLSNYSCLSAISYVFSDVLKVVLDWTSVDLETRDWQLKNGTGNFNVNICYIILFLLIDALIKTWKWDCVPFVSTFWSFISSLLTFFVMLFWVWKKFCKFIAISWWANKQQSCFHKKVSNVDKMT